MRLNAERLTIALVLVLLLAPATVALADDLTHSATEGVTYVTNSGLEVELGDDREMPAMPLTDDETWAVDDVTLTSSGESAVRVPANAYDGESMQITNIDATSNPIEMQRSDLSSGITVEGGADSINLYDVTLDDGTVDLELAATDETTITIDNLPIENGAMQAVDSSGTAVAGDTDVTDGTAELTLDAGQYELEFEQIEAELQIRDIVTQELIENGTDNPIDVEVEFFGSEGGVETRSTTNGTISMRGLPADERFAVNVRAEDYTQRQIVITSLLEQQTAWMLPIDVDIETVEPRFRLEDPSGQFDIERSEIILERPLQIDGETRFVPVAGDRIGLNGYDVILERDQRYRVIVVDPETGNERRLGEFRPTQSEEIRLAVEDVEFNSVSEVDGIDWTARYVSGEDSTADEIEFIFRDDLETQSIDYRIYERGNEDNVLIDGSATGNVTISEALTAEQEETVWIVEWETTRQNGDTFEASRPVSTDRLPIGPANLPGHWETIISMIVLFAVGGLFGAANPGIGGIAVAGTGAMFYLLGWLPDQTGGLMVVLALFIAALSYTARRARGATA